MPLRRISGADAIRNMRSNPYADWPGREPADQNRIEPLCRPAFSPSFKLRYDDKIFTIGSCFARNIERALVSRGFDVVTSRLALPAGANDATRTAILNNYGVASIANELRWALDKDHPFDPGQHVAELAPDRYMDLHLPPTALASLEKVTAYRTATTEVTRRVTDCRIVVMTLGLSELWFDISSGSYLNLPPPRMLVARSPERFEVHLLSFDETMESLRATLQLLRMHCREDQKILLTVSPVPLIATHMDDDVLVVNSYSKSVLRTAAEHIASEHSHVDYFPSFESVILSERSLAWQDDQRHVTQALIDLNVERMIEAYKPNAESVDPAAITSRLSNAEDEIKLKNFYATMQLLEPIRHLAADDPVFVTIYVEACLHLNRSEDAKAAIAKLPIDAGSDWRRRMLKARVQISSGDAEAALETLSNLAQELPKNPAIHRMHADALCELKRWDEALSAVRKMGANLRPNVAEPFRKAAGIHLARGDLEAADMAYQAAIAANTVGANTYLEYVEFLLAQNRLSEAARIFAMVASDSPAVANRYEQLRHFLPGAVQ